MRRMLALLLTTVTAVALAWQQTSLARAAVMRATSSTTDARAATAADSILWIEMQNVDLHINPRNAMRIRSLHPGVTVDEVQELTSFPLVVPDDVPESRLPTDEELQLIREVLDPANARAAEVPE